MVHLDRAFVHRVAATRSTVGDHALRFDDQHVSDPRLHGGGRGR